MSAPVISWAIRGLCEKYKLDPYLCNVLSFWCFYYPAPPMPTITRWVSPFMMPNTMRCWFNDEMEFSVTQHDPGIAVLYVSTLKYSERYCKLCARKMESYVLSTDDTCDKCKIVLSLLEEEEENKLK